MVLTQACIPQVSDYLRQKKLVLCGHIFAVLINSVSEYLVELHDINI